MYIFFCDFLWNYLEWNYLEWNYFELFSIHIFYSISILFNRIHNFVEVFEVSGGTCQRLLGSQKRAGKLFPRVRGFFVVGQFAVRKKGQFRLGQVKLGLVRLGQLGQVRLGFFFNGELSYGEKSQSRFLAMLFQPQLKIIF